jgi:hypothetical protein
MNLLHEFVLLLLEDKWDEYGDVAKEIDRSLPDEAERAISSFVGSDIDKKIYFGIMNANWVEDAYSDNPSEKGERIRKQLEQAIAPLKDKLREVYGRFVPLYRAQMPYRPGKKRNTLSMSQNIEFVKYWFYGSRHGPRKLYIVTISAPEYPDMLYNEQLKSKGFYDKEKAIKYSKDILKSQWMQDQVEEHNDFLKSQYPEEDLVTANDFVIEIEEDLREYERAEDVRKGEPGEIRGRVAHFLVPIDDIIWITNRAGQKEFIVKNKSYTKIPFESKRVAH